MAGVKGRSGGSNRKPVEEHLARGTYRPDRHGALSVVTPSSAQSLPPPPAGLSRARKTDWTTCMTTFTAWTVADLLLLELMLRAMDQAESCGRRIRREGLVIVSKRGIPRPHPLIRVERQAVGFVLSATKQLGLSGGSS